MFPYILPYHITWNLLTNKLVNVRESLEANKNILSSLFSSLQTLLTIAIIGWGATLAVDGQISVGALIGANIIPWRTMPKINAPIMVPIIEP